MSALSAVISTAAKPAAVPESATAKKHHNTQGKGFVNYWDSFTFPAGSEFAKYILLGRFTGARQVPDTTPPTVPVQKPTFLPTRETPKLRATWLGHACYYVEFPGGLRVLFDPVFEPRCSPLSWLGPKRYTEVPCQIAEIPFIDAVVISHNHYDHLSHPTITQIRAKFPEAHYFVPLGNKAWFDESGFGNVTELDWWEERDFSLSVPVSSGEKPGSDTITANFSCLPCQHLSARGLFDRCHTLWASWSVTSGDKKVYFGGDTGYRTVPLLPAGEDDHAPAYDHLPHCPAFAEIGTHRGPFDLGLLPIGAYSPRHLMSPMHADPHDAVSIFKDTKCARAMGIHWGTWVLTQEDVLEPPRFLKEALKRQGLPEEGVFDVCDIGESREF